MRAMGWVEGVVMKTDPIKGEVEMKSTVTITPAKSNRPRMMRGYCIVGGVKKSDRPWLSLSDCTCHSWLHAMTNSDHGVGNRKSINTIVATHPEVVEI